MARTAAKAALADYNAKRDFTRTKEPPGKAGAAATSHSFVIQKHDASRLHYDFRLEMGGVLKSWAVPQGPSLETGVKRLAVRTEDHPLDYAGFEGVIPAGQYGGGTVMVWDRGTWQPEGDTAKGLKKGHLTFTLNGEKLAGRWHLVRMRGKPREKMENWLLIKAEDEDEEATTSTDLLDQDRSVLSGRAMDAIAADADAVWTRKGEVKKPKLPAKAKAKHFPGFIKPMLATLVEKAPAGKGWLHEIKFDGYRLQALIQDGKARLLTRTGLDWTEKFPTIATALAALPLKTAILDGEAIVNDAAGASDFSLLQEALSDADEGAIRFALFDLLHLDGRDLRPLPLVERKDALARLLAGVEAPLLYSEHMEEQADVMIRHACRLGLEGIVAKRASSPYRSGRSRDWLKLKCTGRQEFITLGYQPSTARKGAIGSLLMGLYRNGKLTAVGKVGSGYSSAAATRLFQALQPLRATAPKGVKGPPGIVWVRPEMVVEVEFRGWTGDGMIRHAVFKGVREDKEPMEITDERPVHAKKGTTGSDAADNDDIAGIRLTHPDRLLWEGQGITKRGLAEFYAEIADWILPHLVNRPLSLVRCPGGEGKPCFFAKHALKGLDEAVLPIDISEPGAKDEGDYMMIRDLRGLIALVQMGVLELHPWGATASALEKPDRLVMDLDPGPGVEWPQMVDAALLLKQKLAADGLTSFVKTTGGKGLHVVVPLTPKDGWDRVKAYAHDLADQVAGDDPDYFTSTLSKKARQGRIFIDYLRNGRGATAVAPYSTRARAGAPVATPITWAELEGGIRPDQFTVETLPRRLSSLKHDPWDGMAKVKQTLPRPAKKKG